ARVSFSLVGLVCVALAALSAAVNLNRDLFFHFQLSFTFLALLITMSIVGARAPARLKLGAVIFFLPLGLHFAAALIARLTPGETSSTSVDLDTIAQATLAAAAVVSVPCFAARHHARRLGIAVAAVLVAGAAVLGRLGWAGAPAAIRCRARPSRTWSVAARLPSVRRR